MADEQATAPQRPSSKDPAAEPAKRKRAAAAKRRSWKRVVQTLHDIPGIRVAHSVVVSDGVVAIEITGPEVRVEAIVDQLLRELPE
jgi:hypothetical protein